MLPAHIVIVTDVTLFIKHSSIPCCRPLFDFVHKTLLNSLLQAIVAAPLTVTGSIGVVAGKFNLAELYDRVGYSKTLLSRGKFAELAADNRCGSCTRLWLLLSGCFVLAVMLGYLHSSCFLLAVLQQVWQVSSAAHVRLTRASELGSSANKSMGSGYYSAFTHVVPVAPAAAAAPRSFTPEEAALWEESAQYAYRSFRDKAAASRNMAVEDMQVGSVCSKALFTHKLSVKKSARYP